MAGKQYVVVGPYATVKTMTTDGWRVIGLHTGASLPPDVDQATVDHLVAHALVAEVGAEPVHVDRSAQEQVAYHQANLESLHAQRAELNAREDAAKGALDQARQALAAERGGAGDPNAAFKANQEAAQQREAERAAEAEAAPAAEPPAAKPAPARSRSTGGGAGARKR